MDFHYNTDFILSVVRMQDQKWDVRSQGQTLATFDNPQSACAWAIAYVKPNLGRVLIEEYATSNSTSPAENTVAAFKYSIPVLVTGGGDSRFSASRVSKPRLKHSSLGDGL